MRCWAKSAPFYFCNNSVRSCYTVMCTEIYMLQLICNIITPTSLISLEASACIHYNSALWNVSLNFIIVFFLNRVYLNAISHKVSKRVCADIAIANKITLLIDLLTDLVPWRCTCRGTQRQLGYGSSLSWARWIASCTVRPMSAQSLLTTSSHLFFGRPRPRWPCTCPSNASFG